MRPFWVICPHCLRSVPRRSVGVGEAVGDDAGWCPRCRRAFEVPPLGVPGWILCLIALLAIYAML